MSSRKIRVETTPKSILKKSENAIPFENRLIEEYEIEARYWRLRFDDLRAKKQQKSLDTLRGSIWDFEYDSEASTAIFQLVENHLNKRIDETNKRRGSTRDSSFDFEAAELNLDEELEKEGEDKRKGDCVCSCNRKGCKSGQSKDAIISELRSEVCALIQESAEWKQKYEESIDPERLQELQNDILQDFLQKMQRGIEEAADQFQKEKQQYIQSKEAELINSLEEQSQKSQTQFQLQIDNLQLKINELVDSKNQDSLDSSNQIQSLQNDLEKIINEKKIGDQQIQALQDTIIEQKVIIKKLKSDSESLEEVSEEKEEYRNKEYSLRQELSALQDEYSILREEYTEVHERLCLQEHSIQERAKQVQSLVVSLNQEMLSYAKEVELAHEQEIHYQNEIQRLEKLVNKVPFQESPFSLIQWHDDPLND